MKLLIFSLICITQFDFTKFSVAAAAQPNSKSKYGPAHVLTPRVLARLHQRATLLCESPYSDPLLSCSWVTALQEEVNDLEIRRISLNDTSPKSQASSKSRSQYYYVGSGFKDGECYLKIRRVTTRDVGQWTCILDTIYGNQFRGIIKTELPVPPVVEIRPSHELKVALNASANFKCLISDDLLPSKFTWTRADGRDLPTAAHYNEDGQLTFTSVGPDDVGSYICTAQTEAGNATGTALIDVLTGPGPGPSTMDDQTNSYYRNLSVLDILIITAIIALVALGVIFLCTCCGIKIVRDRKRIRNLTEQVRDLTKEEIDEFYKGCASSLEEDAHAHIYSLPFNGEFEIPRDRLVIHRNTVLGSGEFGVVKQGLLTTTSEASGEDSGHLGLTVAVKMVKPHVEVSHFIALLFEIKILGHLGHHVNIVSLLGAVTENIKNREVYIALEFCPNGDLLRHLRKHRPPKFYNLWSYQDAHPSPKPKLTSIMNVPLRSSQNKNTIISTADLLNWSHQISNGMSFLHSKKVVHGDLAARNILLSENSIAKISDFGLSRQLINYKNYFKKSKTPLPWRWLAIESLTDRTFSLQSDIWSFGVTLWEIFTLGQVPYTEKTWDTEFIHGLKNGQRLGSPKYGNQEIYQLMLNCTKQDPMKRISFQEIMTQLESLGARPATHERWASREAHYLKLSETDAAHVS